MGVEGVADREQALASFIIPVLNEASIVQERLQLLQSLRAEHHELILVDGGSTDATVDLARPLVDVLITGQRGRSAQMNVGAAAAGNSLLVFLHIDSGLPLGFHHSLHYMQLDNQVWGFSPVELDAAGFVFRMISWFMNKRSRITRIATGDQVLCVKRSVFRRIGGFADIELMEDVEICKRLKKISAPMIFPSPVRASGRKWQRDGVWRTVILMWRLRLAYFFGADPGSLRAKYYDP